MNTPDMPQKDVIPPSPWKWGLISVSLVLFGAALHLSQRTSGAWYAEEILHTVFRLILNLPLLLVLVGVVIVWTVFVFKGLGSLIRHPVALIHWTIFPWLIFMLSYTVQFIMEPPSPARYFERFFQHPLPESATDIRIRPENAADPGHVGFAFQCDPADTQKLIEGLGLQPLAIEETDSPVFIFRIPGLSDPALSDGFKAFERIDADGLGIFFSTDAGQSRVYIARHPMAAKAEPQSTPPLRGG